MRSILIVLLSLLLAPGRVPAETVYIDDKVMVGVHREKSADSAIIKLIPSGTALQLIKQDTPLTQVRDPDGIIGWIDNKYLVKIAPGRAPLQAAQEKIALLEAEIARLESGTGNPAAANTNLAQENEELKQLLKSERLKVGELQTQTVELKNRLTQETNQHNDEESARQLEQLAQEKAALQQQIDELQTAASSMSVKNINLDFGAFDWKRILITIAVSLVLGLAAGIYLLDLIVRRRHGGFRV